MSIQVDLVICGLFLRVRVSSIENWPFFWNVSPNLQSFLVFLYANTLYASLNFWSLSIAHNKVQLYLFISLASNWTLKQTPDKELQSWWFLEIGNSEAISLGLNLNLALTVFLQSLWYPLLGFVQKWRHAFFW